VRCVTTCSQKSNRNLHKIDCYDLLDENKVTTEATIQVRFDQAVNATPCILVLRHLEALSQSTQSQDIGERQSFFLNLCVPVKNLGDVNLDSSILTVLQQELAKSESYWRTTDHPLVIVGTTSETQRVPSGILGCFKHVIDFEVPRHAACRTPSDSQITGSK
jgi:peroxin-6